jgi:dienelactone hydrolase
MATKISEVQIPAMGITLGGTLALPENARSLVLFVHGSGSSRFSSRNRFVAQVLQDAGHATLLMDLLTPEEEKVDERTAHFRFDIGFLAGRVSYATEWLKREVETRDLTVGYFGASTGAGAALVAAARRRDIGAVVSRGGRPDMAGSALPLVTAPSLLIVGGEDDVVVTLNQEAFTALRCFKRLEIVPGATHLFEEPGALEEVATLARDWFSRHLLRGASGLVA